MLNIDVIYIMWLRQIKRYWRSKSRIVGSIGQPITFFNLPRFWNGFDVQIQSKW
jgi:hypothetical protein